MSDDSTEPLTLIEADLVKGVHAVPLSCYEGFNTRICRPVGLLAEDLDKVVTFMVESLDQGEWRCFVPSSSLATYCSSRAASVSVSQ